MYARAPLFAVADGMGGAQAGEIASKIAVETLGGGVPEDGGPVEERLADLVHAANERIHELSVSDERRAGMGTTMTAALVGEDEITLAHVGDSRAYLFRDGELTKLTRDHSLVDELVEKGKLTPEEARDPPAALGHHPRRGPEPRVQVDTQTGRRARRRPVPHLQRRSDDDDRRAGDRGDPRRRAGAEGRRPRAHRRRERGGRARQHHRRPVPRRRRARRRRRHGRGRRGAGHRRARCGRRAGHRGRAVRPAGRDDGPPAARARVDDPRRLEPIVPGSGAGRRAASPAPWASPHARDARDHRLRRRADRARRSVALRSVYFLGTNGQGFVTVYRGLPYDLRSASSCIRRTTSHRSPPTACPPGGARRCPSTSCARRTTPTTWSASSSSAGPGNAMSARNRELSASSPRPCWSPPGSPPCSSSRTTCARRSPTCR